MDDELSLKVERNFRRR
uniref:Uncharacterized protein n=1 Tax=Arundo donax TaxID=35708 RepID=A0A0A9FKL9_ARUDO